MLWVSVELPRSPGGKPTHCGCDVGSTLANRPVSIWSNIDGRGFTSLLQGQQTELPLPPNLMSAVWTELHARKYIVAIFAGQVRAAADAFVNKILTQCQAAIARLGWLG